MSNMELRLSKRMKKDLVMVATVDEISQMQVIRDALTEYFEGLDMKWYTNEMDELEISAKDVEKFESESDGDERSDAKIETESDELEEGEIEEETKE
jgi:lipopolysaccharide export LptBFGC system permease protein LptF